MHCKCAGTLVVPEWLSGLLFVTYNVAWKNLLRISCILPLEPGLFVKGKLGACLFKDGIPTSNVLALRVDFTD